MKALINKYNDLLLEKNGEMIKQLCFGNNSCGLRCPLFRVYDWPLNGQPNVKNLKFCHNVTIIVDEIIYENEAKEGKGHANTTK